MRDSAAALAALADPTRRQSFRAARGMDHARSASSRAVCRSRAPPSRSILQC